MCVLILATPKARLLTEDEFAYAVKSSSANRVVGVMWPDRNAKRVRVKKGVGDDAIREVYKAYAAAAKKKLPVAIHIRSGGRETKNAQPFTAWKGKIGYALQGSIDFPSYNETGSRSDANQLAYYLNHLSIRSLKNPVFRKLVSGPGFDDGSLLFMDYTGRVTWSGASWIDKIDGFVSTNGFVPTSINERTRWYY